MAEAATATLNKPAWVDLATTDPAAARAFYAKVFGWDIEVNPDPQYGGYAIARVDGHDAAGIGGMMSPEPPDGMVGLHRQRRRRRPRQRITAAGGKVIAPAFDVGDQGRMAVFQDPSGAFISAWQATRMRGFQTEARTRSAGRRSTPAASTRSCRSTSRSSAGTARRWARLPAVHRVRGRRPEHRRGDRDEPDGARPRCRATGWSTSPLNDVDASHRTAVEGGARELRGADGLPGRPDVDPERPTGRGLRTPVGHRLTPQAFARPIPSARCSASMIVTRCGNPDGASGMIEASITNNRSTPWTRPLASTTAPSSADGPIAHVPTTWGIE